MPSSGLSFPICSIAATRLSSESSLIVTRMVQWLDGREYRTSSRNASNRGRRTFSGARLSSASTTGNRSRRSVAGERTEGGPEARPSISWRLVLRSCSNTAMRSRTRLNTMPLGSSSTSRVRISRAWRASISAIPRSSALRRSCHACSSVSPSDSSSAASSSSRLGPRMRSAKKRLTAATSGASRTHTLAGCSGARAAAVARPRFRSGWQA